MPNSCDRRVEEVHVAERRRAEDHARGARRARRRARPPASAGRRRTAPARRSSRGDPRQVLERARLARRARRRGRRRAASARRRRPSRARRPAGRRGRPSRPRSALAQADGAAALDVDGRVEDHAAGTFAAMPTKLRSSASPSREDFSGWNWAPKTCRARRSRRTPRRTRRADDVGLVGRPADERVHVVEGRGVAEARGQPRRRASASRGSSRCAAAAAPRVSR